MIKLCSKKRPQLFFLYINFQKKKVYPKLAHTSLRSQITFYEFCSVVFCCVTVRGTRQQIMFIQVEKFIFDWDFISSRQSMI